MKYKDWIARYYASHDDIPEGHSDGELRELVHCFECREHGKRTNYCAVWKSNTNPEGYCHRGHTK